MSDIDKMLDDVSKARKVIVEKTGGKRRVQGQIEPCPVCGNGPLNYAVMYNGHIHAMCKTKGCVQWME